MDLGLVSLDGLVGGSDTTTTSSGFVTTIGSCSDPETKHKWYGSGFLKQERSEDDDLRSSKLAKTSDADNGDISASKAMLLRSNATLFSDSHHHQQHQQMMLSFSSPSKPAETPNFSVLDNKNSSPNATLLPYAYHHHPLSSSYTRNTGCYSSSGSNSMVHGGYGGGRGPFTPSQWMELEHQALIYKYITANVPIPSNLLIPIRKALDSAGLYNFSTGLLRPNALGWGGFHLGFSNNNDPEPGRCRRTDGKKWRCSRDAVVDQKYCERHMNRGRHRSRKHVETGATTTTPPNGSKLNAASSSTIMVPGNSPTSSLTFAEPKNMHNLLAPNSNTSAANTTNRMFMNNKENNNASEGMQDGPALPMLPPTLELKPKESHPFMIQKQEINPYDESSSSRSNNEFGLVTCDSLLNPSQKSSTLLGSRSYGSSQNPTNRDTGSQHSLRHFIDDCPKTQSDHRSGSVSWPELDMQSDGTQLSISLPLTSSDFMSFTTSSPTNEKLTLSPLRLSRELDPIQMGLGVGSALNNESNTSSTTTRQANWIPITWESSMGGPLGEVLNLSSNNYYNNAAARDDHCASSALNLMSDGWDNSPPMGSSPTGVLQKTAFGSLSNSSTGSSPRGTDNKTQEVANSLCNDLLG